MKIKIDMGGDSINIEAGADSSVFGGGSNYKATYLFKTSINQAGMQWPKVGSDDIIRFLDISKWKASYEIEGSASPPPPQPPPKEEEKEEEAKEEVKSEEPEEESKPKTKTSLFSSGKRKNKG